MSRAVFLVTSAIAVAWIGAGACTAANETSAHVSSVASSSSGMGGSSEGGASAVSSSSSAVASSSSGPASGAGGSAGGCAGMAFKAEPVPLDIFLMLDQSGSMNLDAGNNLSRWQTIKAAIAQFVMEPSAAGIGLGVQYFGLPDPTTHGCALIPCVQDSDCTNGCTLCMPQGVCESPFNPDIDSCDPTDYAWADAAIATLPGAANAIVGSIGMHAPGTNTPTLPALQGAIMYAAKWQSAHPSHVTVVALATDGQPSECDVDLMNLDAAAAAGLAGKPSIATFVIGVGSAIQALDDLAKAGGTGQAFHVDFDPNATQHFVDAMNTIRDTALPCTFQIPPAPPGMMLDFDLVNVDYKPGNGDPKETFPRVADKAHCPNIGDGWYYDSAVSPTEIILCPTTCMKVTADPMAEVDVVLGCATIIK